MTKIVGDISLVMILALALGLVGCEKSEKVYWEDGKTLRAEYSYVKGRYQITLCESNGMSAFPRIVAKDISLRKLKCYYKNGQLGYENEFVGDKEQGYVQVGVEKGYYKNGKMWYESHYNSKGKQHGTYKSWYENGQLQYETTYKNGFKNGKYKSWYENGQLEYEKSYKEGKDDGVNKRWYKNGQLKSEESYKDGKKDGVFKSWREDGSLSSERHYKNGEEVK